MQNILTRAVARTAIPRIACSLTRLHRVAGSHRQRAERVREKKDTRQAGGGR